MHVSTRDRNWATKSKHTKSDTTSGSIILPVDGIDGLGVAGKYRMPKGFEFKTHQHSDWVIITVLSGRVQVTHPVDDETITVYEPGDVYVVEPGATHRETMLENTEVVVITGPGVVNEQYDTHIVEL